ncbi:RNA-binding (RRM/RBD/RNP motif) family protein [Forsythia ovata]|uniref:RNA-binding (RRM/RBD/RNP motif) family protein n=1 Tax=Forsythia ovata TaxID=205694 RepID=A0ABD1U7T1_9LAMI
MASHEEAVAAITNLESYEFEGRVLKLNWAKPKKIKPSSPPTPKPMPIHNLFVANLPFQARAKDLKDFFNADNGNVVSAEIIFHDNPRRSAGYGFVSFNTKEEAESALLAFQGKEFMGRPIRVARSRRFLRQGTKADIESGNAKSESNSAE